MKYWQKKLSRLINRMVRYHNFCNYAYTNVYRRNISSNTHTVYASYVRTVLLDGFPRSVVQAKMLEKVLSIDVVIALDVPHETIIMRMSNRSVQKYLVQCSDEYSSY